MNSPILAALTAMIELSVCLQKIAQIIQNAQVEKREITSEELAVIEADYQKSFSNLRSAILEKEKGEAI